MKILTIVLMVAVLAIPSVLARPDVPSPDENSQNSVAYMAVSDEIHPGLPGYFVVGMIISSIGQMGHGGDLKGLSDIAQEVKPPQ